MIGGLLAIGTTLLYTLKSIPVYLFHKIKQRLIYTVRIYQYDELFDMVEKWLAVNYSKQYRDVEASVGATLPVWAVSERDRDKNLTLSYKQEENTFIMKYKGKRIFIVKNKEKIDKAQMLKDIYFRKFLFTGIKARRQIDLLLKEIIEFSRTNEEKNTVKIYSNNAYGEWLNGSAIKVKPLEKTILNPTKKSYIIDDLTTFSTNEEWYVDISVPYKRGYAFYGPPGTGKTTLALGIANHLKRSVYCLNLNCLEDDSKLPILFSSLPPSSILLLEDIDRVFSGRDNVKEGSKITFSSLLNCLDGAFYKHGLITIITTNHLDKLDEALLRTGRMDTKMEIPLPSDKEISAYLSLFYKEEIKVEGSFSLTMSDIQGICLCNQHCPHQAYEEIICLIKN